MRPAVSVIMPAYNHERYVAQAIESVLSQTFSDFEFIIVNDGSTDKTGEIIKRYTDPRIVYHCQRNAGSYAAINEGIRQASGTYIAILNSDDVFHDRRIELLIQEAQKVQGIGTLIFSDLEWVDEKGQPVQEHERAVGYRALQQLCRQKAIENIFLVGNIAITSSNLFFSKALYDSVGEFAALRYTHDWEWALRATSGRPPIWVRTNLLSYRVHGTNTILESDVWRHIHENAFVLSKAIWMLSQRRDSKDNPSGTAHEVCVSLLQNESFLPFPALYFMIQRETGVTEAQLLEMVTTRDGGQDLQRLANELSLPAGLFLSITRLIEMDTTIASQAALIEERWAVMQQMSQEIDSRNRWIADLQERLANAEQAMAAQAALIEERWTAMQQMGQEIASRDQYIAELQARLADAETTTKPEYPQP